ncbi:hypothetical protein J5N97_002505 [Dioscorea zingiberensis]|uniref:Uncharacterized protein n=1 Tax=Dioscorea zingiberensis TaxID=325984 RepID=A0A9D5D3V7_9LILI|nr:hypothetical protein J5N97_002505 [Dioscorea zingiberensis]
MIGSLTVFHQLMNFYRLQDFQTDLSRKFRTFRILTPTCNYVYIVEPANVEYILKTNFSNYGKVFSAFGFVHKITTFEKTAGFQICEEFVHAWIGAQVKVPTKFIVGDLDLTYHYPGIQDCSSISNSRASSLTSGRQSMRGNEHVASSYTFQGQMSSSSLLPQQGRQQMFSSGSREYDNAQHQSSYSNPAPDAQYGSMKRE